MLTLLDRRHRYCDGISRRSFLQIGATGLAGLTLPNLLRAEAQSGAGSSNKALIHIFLAGGPPHTDMFDLKPDAPVEYRGEFTPIPTNVPGIEICELMPRLAHMADKFAIVRSIVGTYDDHSHYHTLTGYHRDELKSVGGRPPIGSVLSKLRSDAASTAPPFVSFMGDLDPGFVGAAYRPYRPDGGVQETLRLRGQIDADRLRSRRDLLGALDGIRRDVDRSGAMNAMDRFTQQAVDVVVNGKLGEALDLSTESPETIKRYVGSYENRRGETQRMLLARRLIEAGVRCVALSWGGWDTHERNFVQLREMLPALDLGLSALINDLYDRRMLDDVTIVMWGEFGRNPRVNGGGGRDHWSPVMQAFLAGGGMRTGQVVGSTDRYGGEAADRPVHLREVFATLYHNLGIDAARTTLIDPSGRPQYLVDGREPIRELV